MLSPNAGKQGFLYDSSSNTIHDLSNETETCKIISLDRNSCQIFHTVEQANEAAMFTKLRKPVKCPYCFKE